MRFPLRPEAKLERSATHGARVGHAKVWAERLRPFRLSQESGEEARRQGEDVVCPEAESFARVLIDACGLATFKNLDGQVTSNDVAAAVAAKFSSVYGKSVGELEAEWSAVLDKR